MRMGSLTALGLMLGLAAPVFAQDRSPLRQTDEQLGVGTPAPATQGLVIKGGVAVELSNEEYGRGTGVSVEPEGYVDVEIKGFYAAVWATAADQDYGDDEVDLSFGYRNELASGFGYDLNYIRYYYPDDAWSSYG